MFGHTNPTGDTSATGVQTTGPSEAAGRFPQLFVTSPNYGPGIQIKTKGINYSPRTIIGDGVFDGSGTGPSITQEFFAGTGYNFGSFNQPSISYNHKISNIANSGASGPVFSITTFTNSGVYNYSSVAYRTLIETKNSNKRLELMANGTGGQNTIVMGVSGSSLLSVFGESGATSGGVTIGVNSNITPTTLPLTGSTFIQNNRNNHSLYVTGVQTIGTDNPTSLFNINGIGVTGSGASVGGNSLLKISRNLYQTTSAYPFPKGKGLEASGFSTNNYPNGLEITSYIPAVTSSGPSANKSVAIAVGAASIISPVTVANTTGFFVSDTGQNISIGQYIDDTAAIGVSGAGSDYAIKAKGDVGVTGNLQVIGNAGITGDVDITGPSYLRVNGTSKKIKEYHGSFAFTFNTGVGNIAGKGAGFTSVNDYAGLPTGTSWDNTSTFTGSAPGQGFVRINYPGVANADRSIVTVTPRYTLDGGTYGDSHRFNVSAQFSGLTQIIFYFKAVSPTTSVPTVGSVSLNFSIIEQEW
jgi:hypothetical protein